MANSYNVALEIAIPNICKSYATDIQAFKTQVLAKIKTRQSLTNADIELAQKLKKESQTLQNDPFFENEQIQTACGQILAFCQKNAALLQTMPIKVPEPKILAQPVQVAQPQPEMVAQKEQPAMTFQNAPRQEANFKKSTFGNHYFSPFGVFLGTDNMGTCEIRMVEEALFKKYEFSAFMLLYSVSLNIEKAAVNAQTFGQILNFYLSNKKYGLGKKLSVLRNNSVSVYLEGGHFNLPDDLAGGEIQTVVMGTITLEGENRPSIIAKMESANRVHVKAGGLYCDLTPILEHEYHHATVDKKAICKAHKIAGCKEPECDVNNRPDNHLNAYWVEINSKTWAAGSLKYKNGTIHRIGMYLAQVAIMESQGWEVDYKQLRSKFETFLKIKYTDLEKYINNPVYINNFNLMITYAVTPSFVANP